MQRPTDGHYAERDSKLEIFVKSRPSELMEPHVRGGRKIIRARGDGRHQESMAL
ncbi:hypothetical protein LEMLEM_LOCUS15772 [Lemmus lemmus]